MRHLGYQQNTKYVAVALLLDGCSVNAVARHIGASRTTITKWWNNRELHIFTAGGEARLREAFLKPDVSARLRQRTAEGPPEYAEKMRARVEAAPGGEP